MRFYIFFITVLLATLTFAQGDYVVTLQNDTIQGDITIFANTYFDEVRVKSDDGKSTYKAYQISSIIKDNERYEPITYENKKVIAKLLDKGTLSRYLIRPENEMVYITEVLYKNEQTLIVSTIRFRKRLIDFLQDCEVVVNELEDKTVSLSDLDYVITTYNAECGGSASVQPMQSIDFKELKEYSQLISDIVMRVEKGEEVPNYLIDALEDFASNAMDPKIKQLLVYLKNQ